MTIPIIRENVHHALKEDLDGQAPAQGDITASLIPDGHQVEATIITREECILAGSDWATEAFRQVDENIRVTWLCSDGEAVEPNDILCTLSGPAKAILTAERTALNFLQTLSGTATLTAQYVALLSDCKVKLLDTRKTLPGLRYAQKYAVACGGGKNHRIGLFDAFLIKENHIMACGSITAAVNKARQLHPEKTVEVEVESLDELQEAIDAGSDIVMLDNFSNGQLRKAVELNGGKTRLEVSGNITKNRLTELKDIGVDYISSGALTKNVHAIDLSLRVIKP